MALTKDWWSCDGKGHRDPSGVPNPNLLDFAPSRRGLMMGASMAMAGWLGARSALGQISISAKKSRDRIMVVVFLRGGADGLSIVVPYRDSDYYRARPTLAVASPTDRTAGAETRALDLDGFFGFNPLLAPLLPLYKSGELLALHAVGSQDPSRSHFEAMSAMEKGLAREGSGPSSGWLARQLADTTHDPASPLRAVAIADVMPDSLRGAPQAIAMQSLEEFRLAVGESDRAAAERALALLYGTGRDEVSIAGRETLETLKTLRTLDTKSYRAASGATYPVSDLGTGLKQVAMLIKANLGLEVACLNKGGWDTHIAQGATVAGAKLGLLASLLDDVGQSLAAFHRDMGAEMYRISVVVMTEFGRRVEQNSSLGTDHGRASTMFVLGGGVRGGRVITKWTGLNAAALDEVGDLKVAIDYRDPLSAVLHAHSGYLAPDVFPDYVRNDPGMYNHSYLGSAPKIADLPA